MQLVGLKVFFSPFLSKNCVFLNFSSSIAGIRNRTLSARAYSCTTKKRLCQRAVVVAAQLPVDLILRKLVGWEQPVGAGQAGHGRPAQVILM